METFHIASGTLAADISLTGGSVLRFYRKTPNRDIPLFYRGRAALGEPVCFPMVPFGNRLRGNTFDFEGTTYVVGRNTSTDRLYLHGDGWINVWTILAHDETSATLVYDHYGSDSPYKYQAAQRFEIGDERLTISLSATNKGEFALPYGLGLHPFFLRTRQMDLAFTADRYWLQDDAFLPLQSKTVRGAMNFSNGRSPVRGWMNTEFEGWSGQAEIFWPEEALRLVIDADSIFSRCMVFVSSRVFDATYQGDYFCFEPMTHGVDGHHRSSLGGLVPLRPGESMQGSCRFWIK